MKTFKSRQAWLVCMMLTLSVFLITGCGSSDEAALIPAQHVSVLPGIDTCTESGPQVTFSSPANVDENIALDTLITVTFDDMMDPNTLVVTNPGNPESLAFTLRDNNDLANTEGTVAMSSSDMVATFTPSGNLHGDSWYTVTITTYAKNAGGTSLGCSYQWEFKTAVAPL